MLARAGISRPPAQPRPMARRYAWAHPGALIHIDTARLARFGRPGHRTRRRGEPQRNRGAGWVFVRVVVDDMSRYAYIEQLVDARAKTCAAFLERALPHPGELGMTPEALMTDGAVAYRRSRVFGQGWSPRLAHIITPPWNGRAERLIQTLKRGWAYAHEWPSSTARARALSSWVRTYNRRRPHSSLGDRPPISRVHNLRGQDS